MNTIDSARFKMAIEKAGYTQRSLASKMGYSKNKLNAKVNGRSRVYTDEVVRFCDILRIVDSKEKALIFLNSPYR